MRGGDDEIVSAGGDLEFLRFSVGKMVGGRWEMGEVGYGRWEIWGGGDLGMFSGEGGRGRGSWGQGVFYRSMGKGGGRSCPAGLEFYLFLFLDSCLHFCC